MLPSHGRTQGVPESAHQLTRGSARIMQVQNGIVYRQSILVLCTVLKIFIKMCANSAINNKNPYKSINESIKDGR